MRQLLNLKMYAIATLVLAVGLFAILCSSAVNDPQAMLDRAADVCQSDPARGLALVEASIKAAGGQLTEAQLLRCRLLVKHGLATADADGFSALRDWPETQRAKWLPRLIDLVETEYECAEEKLALEHCEKLAQLAPDSPIPWLISAAIYHQNSQLLRAIEAYRMAFARHPPPKEMVRISYQIVTLALHTGDISVARQQLDYLLKLAENKSLLADGDEEAFQVLRATVLYREQARAAALQVLTEILARWPDSVGGLLLRGTIRLDLRKFQDAIDDLSKVVTQNSFDSNAQYKLGQAYLGLKQTAKAQWHLDESNRLTLLQVKILELQAEFFNDTTNHQLALQLAELNDQRGDKVGADSWRRTAARTRSGSN